MYAFVAPAAMHAFVDTFTDDLMRDLDESAHGNKMQRLEAGPRRLISKSCPEEQAIMEEMERLELAKQPGSKRQDFHHRRAHPPALLPVQEA